MAKVAVERNSKQEWLPPWTRLEHEARYEFASRFVSGKHVVDCACGAGIGSTLFAATASEVLAIDSSPDAVAEAMEANSHANLQITMGDATKIDVPDDSVDVFISLETIEHIERDSALVDEAFRVLKPGGIFICSTPNREMTNPGTSLKDKPWNPFHVREYNLEEFRACLEHRFKIEGVYGQNPQSKSRVALAMRLASMIGTGLVVKINKLLKCRWFVWPTPEHHAVRPVAIDRDYEFYVLIGRVPTPKCNAC
jgi:SAM-dependent methyltransferase